MRIPLFSGSHCTGYLKHFFLTNCVDSRQVGEIIYMCNRNQIIFFYPGLKCLEFNELLTKNK